MRMESIRIENLRAFCDEEIALDDYTCLVGANGAGKSTILTALNIFFRENVGSLNLHKLDKEDFHRADTTKPVKITVSFVDLSAEAQADFSDYFRQGKLIISAVAIWDDDAQCAEVKQYGERLVMRDLSPFFKAEGDGAAVAKLKEIYQALRQARPDLPAPGAKAAMKEALRAYEIARPEQCVLTPSEDQFYGVTKGNDRLRKYIQWVYVPAVKDAATEQGEGKSTALGALLERTVRSKVSFDEGIAGLRDEVLAKYQALLDEKQGHLKELSESLGKRLRSWSHPDARITVAWQQSDKAVGISNPLAEVIAGEGIFDGKISRFGHGLQRSFLIAILQELVNAGGTGCPRLLLGCEEPELYQHPPQTRHLASVLQKLSADNAQVIVSTHSPYFVSGRTFENVRVIRKDPVTHQSCSKQVKIAQLSALIAAANGHVPDPPNLTLAKVHQSLQPSLNEMFFAPVVVLVEGAEDLAYITAYLTLTDKLDEFRRLGCHIVPSNGKDSLIHPIAIAKLLSIPTFVIFDSDGHAKKPEHRRAHEADNRAILFLMDAAAVPFPDETVWNDKFVMWKSEIGKVVSEDIGTEDCKRIRDEVKTKYKLHGRGNTNKNMMFIGHVLAEAWDQGKRSATLQRLCDAMLKFGEQTHDAIAVPDPAPAIPAVAVAGNLQIMN